MKVKYCPDLIKFWKTTKSLVEYYDKLSETQQFIENEVQRNMNKISQTYFPFGRSYLPVKNTLSNLLSDTISLLFPVALILGEKWLISDHWPESHVAQ